MKKIALFIVGIVLIIVGIAGLILPVLPGWALIFQGLYLITPRLATRLQKRIYRKLLKKEVFYFDEWRRYGIDAGFTTKNFRLFMKKTDELLDAANQEMFTQLFWKNRMAGARHRRLSRGFVVLNQVHEDTVAVLEDADTYKSGFHHLLRADGVITNIRRLTLLVMTADCLSVYFIVADKKSPRRSPSRWVGLAHAGWRGTQKGIAVKTFRLLLEKSGVAPAHVRIIFGPSIGADHYKVGQEFREYFPATSLAEKDNKLYFDLIKENERQLVEAGAIHDNISDQGICTMCEADSFHSFRRDGDTSGRMVSFITKL